MAEITIGETLADPDQPVALPAITVDEPSLAMTIGINTSPLSGQDGTKLTARLLKTRLDAELVGNVAIRVGPTERPDMWEVLGRGELQLAVLVETMRREGFELTVGKPQVVTREIDGAVHEPVERVSVDVPDDYLGVVTQLLALRKGSMLEMVNHGTGWVRLDYRVPARGLIGFRTEFLTETRGTGILHHVFDGWEPWHGELRTRRNGSMVADRRGVTTTFALMNLQERGTLIVGPAEDVYEGMIVGENARAEEMDVNPTKEKKLTNIRSSTAEEFERLTPAMSFSLEHALEFIAEDECVEVTPEGRAAPQGGPRPGDPGPATQPSPRRTGPTGERARPERRTEAPWRRERLRNEGFDHMTVVVSDLEGAKAVLRTARLQRTDRRGRPGRGDLPLHGHRRLGGRPRHLGARGCGGPPGGPAPAVPPPAGGARRGAGSLERHRFQPCVLPGHRPGCHAGAPGGARHHAAGRHLGLPRPAPRVHRRTGHRRRVGRVASGVRRAGRH